MSSAKQILWTFVLGLAVLGTATAQINTSSTAPRLSSTITAAASGDRIRIAAPSSIMQMHVEVFAASGEKLFDNEIRGGNVFDWHLQDGQAQRLSAGQYVCVVTVKNISGRLTQKIGTVKVEEKDASVGPAEAAQLSPQQTQAIGPVEENSSWTVLSANENQTTTVIAHDGTDGEIVRGRGALSFRLGDFFSGNDREQMRLTEEGSLGIGTAKPEAKLDVTGTVRARQGFVFNDGSTLNVNEKGALILTASDGTVAPNAAGTGTQNHLAKWLETGGAGTLGDSGVTELANGFVGIGTTNPTVRLDVVDDTSGVGGFQLTNHTNGSSAQLQNRLVNNAGAFAYYGITSSGYTQAPILSNRAFFGSYQADTVIWTQSANDILFATNGLSTATERMRIKSNGNVGIGTPNATSVLHVVGSQPAPVSFDGTDAVAVLDVSGAKGGNATSIPSRGGRGSNISIRAGDGGDAGATGGNGGSITLDPGAGGLPSGSPGFNGGLFLAPSRGSVVIGSNVLERFFKFRVNAGSDLWGLRVETNLTNGMLASFGSIGNFEIDAANQPGGRFEVLENGNVGIGATTPATKLHVSGTGIIRARVNSDSNAGVALTLNNQPGWSVATVTGGQFQIFNDAIGQNAFWIDGATNKVGIGTTSPDQTLSLGVGTASKPGGGSWAVFSDERLKNIKGHFTSGLKAVMQLQPIRYEYKPNNALDIKSEGESIGFSAQAVQKIIPEAVIKNDKGYLLINNDPIIWTMLNAIKEQQQQISDQQEQIKKQQDALKQQRGQIELLKKLICSNHPNADDCKAP